MKAEDIRKIGLYNYDRGDGHNDTSALHLCDMAELVREGVAQLSEANESLKCIAHPLIEVVNEEAKPQEDVKTLRDEFAMAAMLGLTNAASERGEMGNPGEVEAVAVFAYQYADAMLEARRK